MATLPRHQLATILAQQSLQSTSVLQFSQEIAAYLLVENRVGQLDSLLRDIMQYRADHGIVEVLASSAHPLTGLVRADIASQIRRQYPSATQIIISEQLDPTIIGGVRLELANEQLDLSVRSKLNHFKQLTNA
jgi:F-type H+-transporting ATPase subunit delta